MNVSFEYIANQVGRERAGRLRDLTLEIYRRASEYAQGRGIILADTKFEFGFIDEQLTLADEVLTPDSSRYWPADKWSPGGAQFSFDKQYVRDYLERLEPVWLEEESTGLYHASPRDPVWEYVLSPLQADLCLDVQEHRVCLIGHSHVALSFWRGERSPTTGQTRHAHEELDLAEGEWLVNPGSVGQPRDGDPRAAWLELDTDAWRATFRRTEYDVAGAAAAIQAARLPTSLGERLAYGQ